MTSLFKKVFGFAFLACAALTAPNYLKNAQLFMPSEYKEIKSLVNELAEHNDLGDREIILLSFQGTGLDGMPNICNFAKRIIVIFMII